jgi:hypothetical protein
VTICQWILRNLRRIAAAGWGRPAPRAARSAQPPSQPFQIDVSPNEGRAFRVRYSEPISRSLEEPTDGEDLGFALGAAGGADAFEPMHTAYDSCSQSAFSIDGSDSYECLLRATPENVTALRATRLTWSPAARRLAERIGATDQPEAEVRAAKERAARAHLASFNAFPAPGGQNASGPTSRNGPPPTPESAN